jgi:glycosyltransferase involved in cell wall biosynthesis
MPPRVCVIIPAYNSSAHLPRALQSVRRQTVPAEEIIVVDDGSTDDTVAVARMHGAHVITQKNAGPAAARNTGISAASAEWIAFLDADDTWMEAKLERQLHAASLAPQAGMIFSDFLFFDDHGTHRKTGLELSGAAHTVIRSHLNRDIWLCERESLGEALLAAMFILTSSLMIRRDVLSQGEAFYTEMRCAEDYDLFLRLSTRTDAAFIDEALVAYRRHSESITVDLDLDVRSRDQLIARCAAHPERYPKRAAKHLMLQRSHWIARAASFALRSGDFAAARRRAEQSLRARPNTQALCALTIAHLCDNRIGRPLHLLLRTLWSHRPSKYQSVKS